MVTIKPSFFRWLLKHRFLALALGLFSIGLSLFLARDLKKDFSVEQFFPSWDPARVVYERYKHSFQGEDTHVLLFWQEKKALDVQSFQDMEKSARMMEQVGLENVLWLGNAQTAEALITPFATIPHIHPLIEAHKVSQPYLTQILDTYRKDPLLAGWLWNQEQSVFVIRGRLKAEENQDRGRKRVEAELTERLQSLQTVDRKLVLSGIPIVRARFLKYMAQDQLYFLGGGLLLTFILLWIFFQHPGQVFLCLAAIGPAYMWVLGLMGFTNKPMTVLLSTLPIILLVIGVSDTIHLMSHYRAKMQEGLSNTEAIIQTFSQLASPCFYTSLTTAIGFLSLVSTRIDVIVNFALFTAFGLMAAYICAMTLFPVLLSFHSGKNFKDHSLEANWLNDVLKKSLLIASRYPRKILLGTALIILASLGWSSKLEVNTFLIGGLREHHPLMQDLKWIEQQGFGLFQVNIFIEGTSLTAVSEPKAIQWMQDFQQHFQKESLVVKTLSLNDKIKKIREVTGSTDLTATEISRLIKLTQQLQPDFLKDIYHSLNNQAQVILLIKDKGSQLTEPFLERIASYISTHPLPNGLSSHLTGTVQLAQTSFSRTVSGFLSSLLLAVLLIFILMSFMFHSLKFGAIALLPNLFPLFILLALMAILGYQIQPSTVLVFSIAFGLAVDDAIHFLGIFRHERKKTADITEAIRSSLSISGRPIILTSLVIGGGFAVLTFSAFETIFLVGLLVSVALMAALLGNLLILPALLKYEGKTGL